MTAAMTATADTSGGGASPRGIELKGVGRYFKGGAVQALDDVTFDIGPGEFVSLVGPSGCGKTTLLRIIDGLLPADEGQVLVGGVPPVPGRDFGFVFQQARLLPWLSVQKNVEFPLSLQGVPSEQRSQRAVNMLDRVGLGEFAAAYPHELSGGMQQRVGLARAFVMEPKVLLMDEPFAALDAMTREFMRAELSKAWSQQRTAVVFVTHDIDEAIFLSQRIVLLAPRPGRVDEIITVDLPERRWEGDLRSTPVFRELHEHLWGRIRDMVGDSAEWASLAGEGVESDTGVQAPPPEKPTISGLRRLLGRKR
jgi:NitT/TauT family transport system ATP-binding protein